MQHHTHPLLPLLLSNSNILLAPWERDIYCISISVFLLSLCHSILLTQPILYNTTILVSSPLIMTKSDKLAFLFQMFSASFLLRKTLLGKWKLKSFKILKTLHSWARIYIFGGVTLISIAILLFSTWFYFSEKNLQMNESPQKWRVCESWFLFPASYLSVLQGSAEPLPQGTDKRCVSPERRCFFFTYHKCRRFCIQSFSSSVKIRDWKVLLFLLYYIVHNGKWNERECWQGTELTRNIQNKMYQALATTKCYFLHLI